MVAIIKPYREIELNNQTKFAGHVHIKKVDRRGRVTFETKFKNLLLDYFLENGFGGVPAASSRITGVAILIGAGVQTEPGPSDTALGNFKAGRVSPLPFGYTAVVLGNQPSEDYLALVGETTFDYGQANGELTEVGLAVASGSSAGAEIPTSPNHRLIAKSLIKDTNGVPVAVNKTDAEQLIVSYEIRMYRPNEAENTFNISGNDVTLKYLTYQRTPGLEIDLRTDDTGRGGSSTDLLAGVSGQSDYISQHHGLYGLSLYKASCPAVGGDSRYRGSMSDHNLALPGLQFEAFYRLNPTTADRSLTGLSQIPGNGFGSASAQAPAIIYGQTYINNNTHHLRFIDPVTGYVKPFLLPANYRLDLVATFQRGRK